MVIAALRTENEFKNILCNTVRDLKVTLNEIKIIAQGDTFVREKKAILSKSAMSS